MSQSASLTYLQGDVLQVEAAGKAVIVPHISNDVGKWGKGFTAALDAVSKVPRRDYMQLWSNHKAAGRIPRGQSLMSPIPCRHGTRYIFTMVVQAGCGRGLDRVDYLELERCLQHLRAQLDHSADAAKRPKSHFEIHMPKIGTGYAGGNWEVIETIIRQTLVTAGFNVFVYELG